jgi:hypothetical protein
VCLEKYFNLALKFFISNYHSISHRLRTKSTGSTPEVEQNRKSNIFNIGNQQNFARGKNDTNREYMESIFLSVEYTVETVVL